MTQPKQQTLPGPRLVLLAAALLAAVAIAFSVHRVGSSGGEAANGSDSTPVASSIEALEARTREDPDDANAWQRLGLSYFEAGRFGDAAEAYGNAARLDPEEALLWSALGEARVMASARNPMPGEALVAFRKAVALDPGDPRARYFLAVERDLSGDHRGAIADWLTLLEETPADAPWRGDLIRTIEQVGKINDIDVTGHLGKARARSAEVATIRLQALPGPSAADLAAASKIPPGEQREMARDMVARLEKRLEDDPGNVEGWIMLMRSRMTLGEASRAKQALNDAVSANPDSADLLRQQAHILGIR